MAAKTSNVILHLKQDTKFLALAKTTNQGMQACSSTSWKRKQIHPPRALGGQYIDLDLNSVVTACRISTLQNYERLSVCWFKCPNMWSFVTLATRN